MRVAEETLGQAQQVAEQLEHVECHSVRQVAAAGAIGDEIRHFVPFVNQVLSQAERRVLRGESVPATEKSVSIFEPHTDIIIKDNRETEYGHKVCLTTGSALVTSVVVERGNPADSTRATKMLERHSQLFGKSSRQASFDGGFASRTNLADIKAMGVEDVVFHKRRGLEIAEMPKSKRIYKKLRAFRAGIEWTISFLERVFGLERCTWRSFASGIRTFRRTRLQSASRRSTPARCESLKSHEGSLSQLSAPARCAHRCVSAPPLDGGALPAVTDQPRAPVDTASTPAHDLADCRFCRRELPSAARQKFEWIRP